MALFSLLKHKNEGKCSHRETHSFVHRAGRDSRCIQLHCVSRRKRKRMIHQGKEDKNSSETTKTVWKLTDESSGLRSWERATKKTLSGVSVNLSDRTICYVYANDYRHHNERWNLSAEWQPIKDDAGSALYFPADWWNCSFSRKQGLPAHNAIRCPEKRGPSLAVLVSHFLVQVSGRSTWFFRIRTNVCIQ